MTRTPKQIAADKVAELIERLEAAEGPDQAIDTDICLALQYGGGNSIGATNVRVEADWDGDLLFEIDGEECCNPVPALTASLDAAVALAERVLPGWYWRCGRTVLFPDGWAYVSRLHADHCTERDEAACSDGKAANVAIALCLATLKAVRAHMHPRDREETK